MYTTRRLPQAAQLGAAVRCALPSGGWAGSWWAFLLLLLCWPPALTKKRYNAVLCQHQSICVSYFHLLQIEISSGWSISTSLQASHRIHFHYFPSHASFFLSHLCTLFRMIGCFYRYIFSFFHSIVYSILDMHLIMVNFSICLHISVMFVTFVLVGEESVVKAHAVFVAARSPVLRRKIMTVKLQVTEQDDQMFPRVSPVSAFKFIFSIFFD